MARHQRSSLLQFFLALVVLVFCLAVTTEGRSVPLVAQLTPENTGKVNSNNKKYVGQALAYLSSSGKDFHASILVVANINPSLITKVTLYDVEEKKAISGAKFTKLKDGYYVYDARIKYETGAKINVEKVSVNIYTKEVGSNRAALSGVLVNNRTSFLGYLQADQAVTTPTGTAKNDGYVTGVAWTNDNANYFLSLVVNHDLDEKITNIQLHAAAASNTDNQAVATLDILVNAGKVINAPINASVYYWLTSHLSYVNIHTSKNPNGALRAQLIPTTTSRIALPTFPNKATVNVAGSPVTFLPDGSAILGDVGAGLRQGGARNLTGNATDDRVAQFTFNATSGSFDNDFRFALPVTIKNRFSLRGAVFYVTAAADIADNAKWNVGLVDLSDQSAVTFAPIPGNGRRNFSSFQFNIDADLFPRFLGPGGLFASVTGTGLTGDGLFVDRFYMMYYVSNAYANNVMKDIFFKGSTAE